MIEDSEGDGLEASERDELVQDGLVEGDPPPARSLDEELLELPPKARRLIALAVQGRADTLKALAKKLDTAQGYPTEARHLTADADALTTLVLPLFEEAQGELLETDEVEVRAALSNRVLDLLRRRRLQGRVLNAETGEVDENAPQRVADALAWAIFQFGQRMYEAGYSTARIEGDADPTRWWSSVLEEFQPATEAP